MDSSVCDIDSIVFGDMVNFSCLFPGTAGAVTTPESIASPDAPKKMIGSSFIYEAKSIEE
jgi:hypothetical protein